MRYQRNLTLFGVLFLAIVIMTFFYLSSQEPKNNYDTLEQTGETLTSPTVTYIDPIRGSEDAPVTIVEFSDFGCAACANLSENIVGLQEELPGKIRHVFKVVPNDSLTPLATTIANAAYCAGDQGYFWEFHDTVFANQSLISNETLTTIATALELDLDSFQSCIDQSEALPLIQRNYEEAVALSITALPTIYINGERYAGSSNYDTLERVIRELLAEYE